MEYTKRLTASDAEPRKGALILSKKGVKLVFGVARKRGSKNLSFVDATGQKFDLRCKYRTSKFEVKGEWRLLIEKHKPQENYFVKFELVEDTWRVYFLPPADEGAVGADEGAVGGEAMTGTDTESTEPEAVADEISLVESIRVDEPIGPGALAGEPDLMRSLPPLLHKKQRSKKEPRSQNLLRNVLADESAVRGEAESATNTDVPTGPGSIAGEIDLLGSLPPLLHKKQRSKIPPGEPKECKESIPDEGAVRGEAESATNTDVPTGPGAIAGEIDLMGSLPPLLHKKQRSKKPPLEPKECKESSQNFPPNVHANEGVVAAANTDEPTDPGVVAASNTNEATGPGAVTETSTDGLVMLALAAAELAGPVGEAVAGTNTDEPTGSGAVAETNADIERLVMLAAVASGLTGPGGESYNHR